MTGRDYYSRIGLEGRMVQEKGRATVQLHSSPILRKGPKEPMQNRDGPPIGDTLIWFAALALVLTRCLGWCLWRPT